jgi:hypothetical protein
MGETVVVYSSIKFHGTSATITRMLLQLHEIYAQHIPGKHCPMPQDPVEPQPNIHVIVSTTVCQLERCNEAYSGNDDGHK